MYHGTIIEIDDCLVSEEILTEYFACDYEKCKGCCCVIGDSGAPMEECEAEAIEKNYPIFSQIIQCILRDPDAPGTIHTPLHTLPDPICCITYKGHSQCSIKSLCCHLKANISLLHQILFLGHSSILLCHHGYKALVA